MSEGLFVDYVKTGNVELFDKLEKETRDRVLNTVYRVLGDEGLSQEVTQEVYIKVFKRTMRGKTITNGDGYLIGMARNEAEARLRTELRRIAAEQFSPRHEAYKEQNGYSEEDLKVVRDAVFKLPQRSGSCHQKPMRKHRENGEIP